MFILWKLFFIFVSLGIQLSSAIEFLLSDFACDGGANCVMENVCYDTRANQLKLQLNELQGDTLTELELSNLFHLALQADWSDDFANNYLRKAVQAYSVNKLEELPGKSLEFVSKHGGKKYPLLELFRHIDDGMQEEDVEAVRVEFEIVTEGAEVTDEQVQKAQGGVHVLLRPFSLARRRPYGSIILDELFSLWRSLHHWGLVEEALHFVLVFDDLVNQELHDLPARELFTEYLQYYKLFFVGDGKWEQNVSLVRVWGGESCLGLQKFALEVEVSLHG